MAATENFRRQHAELAALAGRLLELTREPDWLVGEVSGLLSEIAGKLRIHAAMEDEALYPRLFDHADPGVRSTARAFRDEFGAVYDEYFRFRERWPKGAIARDPDAFVAEVEAVIAALRARVRAENGELYRMVDELYPD